MTGKPGKRVAKMRVVLTKRVVDALEPADKSWIAWDNLLVGFGVRVQPSGVKSFIVNYRVGRAGRRARNRRVVIARHGVITVDEARAEARGILSGARHGEDPMEKRVAARAIPTLREAFEEFMGANVLRTAGTNRLYRHYMQNYLGDWLSRPIDTITFDNVEARFNLITKSNGKMSANGAISLLLSVYKRSCAKHEGLRNPVVQWRDGTGKFHPKTRREIPPPVEVLPCWRAGIEGAAIHPVVRDALWFGLYTGMRRGEVLGLRWDEVNIKRLCFTVDEARTKNKKALQLPITRQLGVILDRRRTAVENLRPALRKWVFPAVVRSDGHTTIPGHIYKQISEIGGEKFWYHAFRNCFITVCEQEFKLPTSMTKRLVNHAKSKGVTGNYVENWSLSQLREPAQRVADRLDELMYAESDSPVRDRFAPVQVDPGRAA